jgi:uncharacterized protein YjbJ (UPF0337 family)
MHEFSLGKSGAPPSLTDESQQAIHENWSSIVSEPDQEAPVGGLIDRVKGTAKQVAGAVTGNEDLKREGQLHHEKVDAVHDAAERAKTAEREQAAAELTAREKEIAVEQQRLAADTAAVAREDQAEHDRAVAEQKIEAETAQREAGIERQKQVQLDTAARSEQHAAAERTEASEQAAKLEAEAARAKQTADALDKAAEEIA